MKKYEGIVSRIVRCRKEDLKLPNHLMGHQQLFLQLCIRNLSDLTVCRDVVPPAIANSAKRDAVDTYAEVVGATADSSTQIEINGDFGDDQDTETQGAAAHGCDWDPRDTIIDIQEFNVPYYLRVAINNEMRVGLWYTITFEAGQPTMKLLAEHVKRADPVISSRQQNPLP